MVHQAATDAPKEADRRRDQLISAFLSVVMVAAAAAIWIAGAAARDDLARFSSSPQCAAGAPAASDCRAMTNAKVLDSSTDASGHGRLSLDSGQVVVLDPAIRDGLPAVGTGVAVTSWHGSVVQVTTNDRQLASTSAPGTAVGVTTLLLATALGTAALTALVALEPTLRTVVRRLRRTKKDDADDESTHSHAREHAKTHDAQHDREEAAAQIQAPASRRLAPAPAPTPTATPTPLTNAASERAAAAQLLPAPEGVLATAKLPQLVNSRPAAPMSLPPEFEIGPSTSVAPAPAAPVPAAAPRPAAPPQQAAPSHGVPPEGISLNPMPRPGPGMSIPLNPPPSGTGPEGPMPASPSDQVVA